MTRTRGAPSPSSLIGVRHRADYSRPPPNGLRTAYRIWITDLVDHFGPVEVANWDRPILLEMGDRIVQITVNRRPYHAWSQQPGAEPWTLYAGARLLRSRRVATYEARRRLPKCSCAGGGNCSYKIMGGRVVGRAVDFDELCDIAVQDAPARPPRGWTFDDWRMRGFVPDLCSAKPANAD